MQYTSSLVGSTGERIVFSLVPESRQMREMVPNTGHMRVWVPKSGRMRVRDTQTAEIRHQG